MGCSVCLVSSRVWSTPGCPCPEADIGKGDAEQGQQHSQAPSLLWGQGAGTLGPSGHRSQVRKTLVSPGEDSEAADTRWHHPAGEHRHPEPLQRSGVRDQQEPAEDDDPWCDRLHHHEESR